MGMLFILSYDTAYGVHIASYILDISLVMLTFVKILNVSSVIHNAEYFTCKPALVMCIIVTSMTFIISLIITVSIIVVSTIGLEIFSSIILILII